jgi:hypothetical protein
MESRRWQRTPSIGDGLLLLAGAQDQVAPFLLGGAAKDDACRELRGRPVVYRRASERRVAAAYGRRVGARGARRRHHGVPLGRRLADGVPHEADDVRRAPTQRSACRSWTISGSKSSRRRRLPRRRGGTAVRDSAEPGTCAERVGEDVTPRRSECGWVRRAARSRGRQRLDSPSRRGRQRGQGNSR